MTTDELVSIMRFVLDEASREALEKAEQGPKNIAKAVEEMSKSQARAEKTGKETNRTTGEFNKVFKTSNNILNKTSGVISSVTSGLKSFGIVSMVASGGMAAWGVNAANSARDLTRLSHSLQLSTEEIQTIGSVYKQVGGTLDEFASDADGFLRMTGESLNLKTIVEQSREFKNLSERDALNMGRAFGLSDSLIKLLRQGGEAIKGYADDAKRLGQVNTAEQIEKLNALSVQWENTKGTIQGVSTSIQSEIAPALSQGLGLLNDALIVNKGQIELWAASVSGTTLNVIEGLTGRVSDIGKIIRENGKTFQENIRSDNPEEVRRELEQLKAEETKRRVGNALGFLGNMIKRAVVPGGGVIDAFQGKTIVTDFQAALSKDDELKNTLRQAEAQAARNRGEADPLQVARLSDEIMEKWKQNPFSYFAIPGIDVMGDRHEQAYSVARRMIAAGHDTSTAIADIPASVAAKALGRDYGREFQDGYLHPSRYELPVPPQSVVNNSAGDTHNTANSSNSDTTTIYNENHFYGYDPEAIGPVITDPQRIAKTSSPGINR